MRQLLLCGLLVIGGCLCGCDRTLSQQEIEGLSQQVNMIVKGAQEAGLDANAAVWLEVGPDIGGLHESITGPLKLRAFVQITARPKPGLR